MTRDRTTMASTLGHALCGIDCLLLGRLAYPRLTPALSLSGLLAYAALANVPDLDLLLGPMLGEHPHYLHGQFSHSVVFALSLGLLTWGMCRLRLPAAQCWQWALLISVPLLSHVLVDWFTGPHPGLHPSFGTLIAWPFSWQRIHAPLTLFLGPHHASLDELFSLHNIWVMASEALIFGGLAALLLLKSATLKNEFKTLLRQVSRRSI